VIVVNMAWSRYLEKKTEPTQNKNEEIEKYVKEAEEEFIKYNQVIEKFLNKISKKAVKKKKTSI
jgi:Na+/phosphate symporter